jgi:AcrR family transcriptional regulator
MDDATSPARPDRRQQRNRAALLEAAVTLFQERGVRATKLEEICAAADVAPRTFFNHFDSREQLVREIAEQRAERIALVFDVEAERPAPFDERLTGLLSAIGRYVAARPLYRELMGEMLAIRADGGSAFVRGRVVGDAARRFVEAGVARGEITRRHAPAVLADLLLGVLDIALTNWCAGPGYDLEGGLDASARALLDLFTPAAGEPTAH